MPKKYWIKHLETIPREQMNFLKFLVDGLEYEVIDGRIDILNYHLGFFYEKKDKVKLIYTPTDPAQVDLVLELKEILDVNNISYTTNMNKKTLLLRLEANMDRILERANNS